MVKALSFLKPYRIQVTIALILMLTELTVELVHPLLMAKIIDDGIIKGDLQVVIYWGAIMIGMSLLAFLAGIINSFYAAHVSQSYGFDIRKHLYEKVQAFSFANFNKFPTSSLITRMTNDVTQLQNTIFMGLRIMLRAPLLIIGGVIMSLVVNVKLAFLLVVTVPVLFFFLVWVMNKGGALFSHVQKRLDAVNGVMRENLVGMRLIKAFLRRNHEVKRFTKANEELREKTVSALRLMETTMPLLLVLMNASIIAILWFGSFNVNNGGAQVGEVVAIVHYAMRITSALSVFSWIVMAFSRARASANRIVEVLDTEIDLTESTQVNHEAKVVSGRIEFQGVSFKYPDTTETVLDDISFHVNPGETVAILGATGSGKTSLFQLIPRLYDVSAGKVLIDGQDVTFMKMENIRKQIGYVPQEALLFTGSVRENIEWGKDHASMDEIIKAAKDAQIHQTIEKLPKQYETVLGQKGVNLSGGQKQRLSIARALIRNPKILLLDDSTSALDLKTEAKLLKAIREYTCTTLIITQKISTAIEADKILLLEEGRLIAEGSHPELLKESPLYKRIYISQYGEEVRDHVRAVE
ncbi:ABC transporter ATP-binding protein [Bacillus pinisoli]|uniref:ABC transporter ATP-binding protein n=1 Tax=Bacillus pinisoli TaxID=2901866 RepID=UPI001FF4502B|nr:ABC transporter ATP-binding protein [Bacillus pinisoli]